MVLGSRTTAGPQHFFKVILPAALQEKKLRIPDKFVRKFGDELSTFATLTVSNGRVWQVGLSKDGGKIWFHDGWDNFIEHHSISSGYFLVFKYKKDSNFHVLIFDMTCCEIHYPYNGEEPKKAQNSIHHDEIENEDSLEIFGSSKRNRKQATNLDNSSSKGECEMRSKKCKMEELLEHVKETNHVNDSKPDQCSNRKICNPRGTLHREKHLNKNAAPSSLARDIDLKIDKTKFKTATHDGEDERTVQLKDEHEILALLEEKGISVSTNNVFLSVKERAKILNIARSLKPKKPSFMIILRQSHMHNSYVCVPVEFSNKYLRQDVTCIKMQYSNGKEWPVKITWDHGRCRTQKGWTALVKIMNVKVGDICMLELIRMKDLLLKVSVF